MQVPDSDASALYKAAVRILRSGNRARALELFDAALQSAPEDPACLHGRGIALHALGDIAGALDAFRRAAGGAPADWTAWESIADVANHEAERVHALGEAAHALEHRCRDDTAPAALFTRCSNALIDAHRFTDAVRFCATHQARFTSPAAASSALARALYSAGDFYGAFHHKARALRRLAQDELAKQSFRPGFNPGAARQALRGLIEILEGQGIAAFLAAGTLLGFHRSGGPLSHDRDIDIGVVQVSEGAPDMAALLRAHPSLLMPRAARAGDRYFGIMFKGVAADVFLHEPKGGTLECGLGYARGDIQWRFTRFGIARQDYAGETWPVPDNPQRYLAETYGPGWQTPDTGFASAVSSPALHETDPYARAYYAAARALKALLTNEPAKARALQRQSPVSFALPAFIGDPEIFHPLTEVPL